MSMSVARTRLKRHRQCRALPEGDIPNLIFQAILESVGSHSKGLHLDLAVALPL